MRNQLTSTLGFFGIILAAAFCLHPFIQAESNSVAISKLALTSEKLSVPSLLATTPVYIGNDGNTYVAPANTSNVYIGNDGIVHVAPVYTASMRLPLLFSAQASSALPQPLLRLSAN